MDGGFADPRGPGMSPHSLGTARPGLPGPCFYADNAGEADGPGQCNQHGRDRSRLVAAAGRGGAVCARRWGGVVFHRQYRMIYAARGAAGDRLG
jgi:hypothetical protein